MQTEQLIENGVFSVIRMSDEDKILKVIDAVRKGGVKCIEITMTVPHAFELIKNLVESVDDKSIVGAGTVTSLEDAKKVVELNAKFVATPVLIPDIIQFCNSANIPVIVGCFTPTEIFQAYKTGANIIKIFPAVTLGTEFLKEFLAPFPNFRVMVSGGISISNVGDWVAAGAKLVAVGKDLLNKRLISEERYDIITSKAMTLMSNFNEARLEIELRKQI